MQMNLAYGPLDDPSKVMAFAAMVNIGGNASYIPDIENAIRQN